MPKVCPDSAARAGCDGESADDVFEADLLAYSGLSPADRQGGAENEYVQVKKLTTISTEFPCSASDRDLMYAATGLPRRGAAFSWSSVGEKRAFSHATD